MVWRIGTVVAALWLLSTAALAGSELRLIPTATLYDGNRRDICLLSDSAYVASATGLEIFDISIPTSPHRAGQVIRYDGGLLVAAKPGMVVLATGSDSLLFLALPPTVASAKAGPPMPVAAWPARGRVGALRLYREHLYLADSAGWQRIRFSEPWLPILDHIETTPASPSALGFCGDSLFVVRSDGMTQVCNIGGEPVPVGSFASRPNISSVVFSGDLACAAAGDSGVFVYDLRQGMDREIGRFYTYGTALELLFVDTLLCVADARRGLMILSLSDPRRPFLLSADDQPRGQSALAAERTTVCVTAENGVFVYDVSNPFRLSQVGRVGDAYRVGDVAIQGDLLAAAVDGAGLALVDLADPSSPRLISETSFGTTIRGLDLAGHIAALACGEDGLLLVDVSQPNSPELLFSRKTIGVALDVAVDDSLAVVADGPEGLRIFDVAIPRQSRLIGGKSTSAAVTTAARRERYVFAIGPELGFEVYDISFAFKPRLVYQFAPAGRAQGLTLADSRAFLSVDSAGVFVFDIANPGSPLLVDHLTLSMHPRQVAVEGGLLLVADDSVGVVMIDYRAKGAASLISSTPFRTPPAHAAGAADVLCVSADPYLHLLHIDPAAMPGDVTDDGSMSLADVVYLVNFLFRQGPLPLRTATADLNSDGRLNLVDLAQLIRRVFP